MWGIILLVLLRALEEGVVGTVSSIYCQLGGFGDTIPIAFGLLLLFICN